MKKHYDFANMEGKKNPYVKYLKQPVTMRLDYESVDYFKSPPEESGIPHQTLINLYLRDCTINYRNPASAKVIEKAGFAQEGVRRRHIKKWDDCEDLIVYGLLKNDWVTWFNVRIHRR